MRGYHEPSSSRRIKRNKENGSAGSALRRGTSRINIDAHSSSNAGVSVNREHLRVVSGSTLKKGDADVVRGHNTIYFNTFDKRESGYSDAFRISKKDINNSKSLNRHRKDLSDLYQDPFGERNSRNYYRTVALNNSFSAAYDKYYRYSTKSDKLAKQRRLDGTDSDWQPPHPTGGKRTIPSRGSVMGDEGRMFGSLVEARGSRTPIINITGGPLSYRYQVTHVQLHFGSQDNMGSEHAVNSTPFPAEVQVFGFNSQLFGNYSEAVSRAHGIVVLAIMVQIGTKNINPELRLLTDAIDSIKFAGSSIRVSQLSVQGLLPSTDYFLTYEGSLTQPPCHETVTWVILNKPIYVTRAQLRSLRELHQGTPKNPKAKMVNNFRPTQTLYHRPLRTNIDFSGHTEGEGGEACPSMTRQMYYTANTWR